MDPDELIRKIGQSVPHQPETDWAGRPIPLRTDIEAAINRSNRASFQLSKRELRRMSRRGPERG